MTQMHTLMYTITMCCVQQTNQLNDTHQIQSNCIYTMIYIITYFMVWMHKVTIIIIHIFGISFMGYGACMGIHYHTHTHARTHAHTHTHTHWQCYYHYALYHHFCIVSRHKGSCHQVPEGWISGLSAQIEGMTKPLLITIVRITFSL